MTDHRSKPAAFAGPHRTGTFVVPDPRDAGTARVPSGCGFSALATTSARLACGMGRADGVRLVAMDETRADAKPTAEATHPPVTAAPEDDGHGNTAEGGSETVGHAAGAGPVGASTEVATGEPGGGGRDSAEAADRVAAAVEAARAQTFPFTSAARADTFFQGRPDLHGTIRRPQAFAEAGTDVRHKPALPAVDTIGAVCSSLDRPVGVPAAGPVAARSVPGVNTLDDRRISLGSVPPRTAPSAVLTAGAGLAGPGTSGVAEAVLGYDEYDALPGRP